MQEDPTHEGLYLLDKKPSPLGCVPSLFQEAKKENFQLQLQ